ncbi:MAG: hypothetical protein WDW36_003971 [Sanguina aurantia]
MNGASSKNVNSQSETACLDQGEEVLPELITFSSGEAFFYLIPPAASYGHRAELWDVDAPAREVRVLLVLSSEDGVVRLLEHPSGVVFAECPLPTDGTSLTTVVEPVLDSSRYFVLRVAHRSSNNHAFIGVGFRTRGDSSNFSAALDDYRQQLRRMGEAAVMRQEYERQQQRAAHSPAAAAAAAACLQGQPALLSAPAACSDGGSGGIGSGEVSPLALQPGQTITLNLGSPSPGADAATQIAAR